MPFLIVYALDLYTFLRNVASAFAHALGSKASFLAFCISPRFPWIAPILVFHIYFFLKPGGLSMYSNCYIFEIGLKILPSANP